MANNLGYDPTRNYQEEINKAKAAGQSTTQLELERARKIADANDEQLKSYKVNRAGQDIKTPSLPYGPETLSKSEMAILAIQKNVRNDITVYDENGNSVRFDGYALNGQTYLINDDGTGIRMLDYGDGKGVYKQDKLNSVVFDNTDKLEHHTGNQQYDSTHNTYAGTTTIILKNDPVPIEIPIIPPVQPIIYPPFISWNEPAPTFSSNLKEVSKYSYFFGLDKLEIKNVEANQNCCFISQEILLGNISEDCYIQFEGGSITSDSSSVEFYILDGGLEFPMLPIGNKLISNEKLFFGLDTRFAVDLSKEVIIKKNGFVVDMSLEKAKQSNDGIYTVTYYTTDEHSYKPINSSIKLKVIMRLYKKGTNSPYINKMKIRKFGGGTLWKDISVI